MRSKDEWKMKKEHILRQGEVESSIKGVLKRVVWNEAQVLGQGEIDAIVEDVLRSTVLSQTQKDDMVEDIRSWPSTSQFASAAGFTELSESSFTTSDEVTGSNTDQSGSE